MTANASIPGRRATLMSLAHQAGVSHTTVSAVLRGVGHISQKRRQQILQMAERLGYTPHTAAQVLRTKRSGHIGLILSGKSPSETAESGFEGPILAAFLEICEKRKQKYHIEFYRREDNAASRSPRQLNDFLVDGIIVVGFIDEELRKWLNQECRAPWVSLDEPGAYTILTGTDRGFADAVERLHEMGHRRFSCIGWDAPFTTQKMAMNGYRSSCHALGLLPRDYSSILVPMANYIQYEKYAPYIYGKVRRLLKSPNAPTALICTGTDIARIVLLAAVDMGYSVPINLSIVSQGARRLALQSVPQFSIIEPDLESMVDQAITILQTLLRGEKVKNKTLIIPTRFCELGSTGPAPLDDAT